MIGKVLGSLGLASVVGHILDKEYKATVSEPKVGSILYTGLLADAMEHTGIYIGNGKVIELNNDGHITEVTPEEFINGGTGINIYVSSQGKYPVGSSLIAERAINYEREVGVKDYNLLLDNCHMFTSACITGKLDNSYSFLWMVKDLAKRALSADSWLVWRDPQKCCHKKNQEIIAYTPHDLTKTRAELKACREQSNTLWSDIKAYTKLIREHAENGPTSWFYTTDSRLEQWEKRRQELEQIDYVNTRKHDDLMAEEKRLEEKVQEISDYISKK